MTKRRYWISLIILLCGLPSVLLAQSMTPTEIKTTLDWATTLGVNGILLCVIGAMGWIIVQLSRLYLAEAKDKDNQMAERHKEMLEITKKMTQVIESNTIMMEKCHEYRDRS